MAFEFNTAIGETVCQIRAARENFLRDERVNDRPHKHYAIEFHCVFRGMEIIDLPDENRKIPLREGQILLIPQGNYHGVTTGSGTVDRICFHFSTEKSGRKSDAFSALLEQATKPLLFEDDYARSLMELCRTEQLSPATPRRNTRMGLLMISAALRLLSCKFETAEGRKVGPEARDKKWIIMDYIERNFTDADGLAGLAKTLFLSQRQTSSLVKKYLGVDFKTAVRSRRMELADIYLRRGDLSLEEIAWQVGYRSYSGFQLSFREHFGTTPSARRKQLQQAPSDS